MRLICAWHRRQLARRLLLGEPIAESSLLGRHLARCTACARVRGDLALLQGALQSRLPAPEVSPDFSARLRTRLQRELNERRAADGTGSAAPARSLPMDVLRGLALAACAIAALALWNPRPGGHGNTRPAR